MAEVKKEKPVTNKKEVKKENVVEFESTEIKDEADKLEKLAPQWIIYYKLCEFLDDTEITINDPEPIFDEPGTFEIVISSKNFHKITAIAKVFESEVNNVKFRFKYEDVDNDYVRTLTDLFTGNKHFDNIRIAHDAMGGLPVVITTFKDETIQYKADNRFVPGGYSTTLAENLVKEFFKEEYRRSVYITKEKELSLYAGGVRGTITLPHIEPYTLTWTGDSVATETSHSACIPTYLESEQTE